MVFQRRRTPHAAWSILLTGCVCVTSLCCDTALAQEAPGGVDLSLPREPELLWKVSPLPQENENPEAPDFGGIRHHEGLLFTTDRNGGVYAISTDSGEIAWGYRKPEYGGAAVPTVAGETIYFANALGVVAIAWKDGSVNWQHPIVDGAAESAPVVVGEQLYTASYNGLAYALRLQDGSEVWTADIVSGATSSERARLDSPCRPRMPATDGESMFLPIFDQSRVVALDLKSGEHRWTLQTDGWIYPRPVLSDQFVLIGSQDRRFYCVDKRTGEVEWTDKLASRIEAEAAVHAGSVYYGSCAGEVVRTDIESGQPLWTFRCDFSAEKRSPIYCKPIVTDELVYLANMEGQVYAIENDSGKLRWKVRPLPGSEIVSGLETDGTRLFMTTRPTGDAGENSVIAIGYRQP